MYSVVVGTLSIGRCSLGHFVPFFLEATADGAHPKKELYVDLPLSSCLSVRRRHNEKSYQVRSKAGLLEEPTLWL